MRKREELLKDTESQFTSAASNQNNILRVIAEALVDIRDILDKKQDEK